MRCGMACICSLVRGSPRRNPFSSLRSSSASRLFDECLSPPLVSR